MLSADLISKRLFLSFSAFVDPFLALQEQPLAQAVQEFLQFAQTFLATEVTALDLMMRTQQLAGSLFAGVLREFPTSNPPA